MWVLLEQALSKPGKEVYFKDWTPLGPATTNRIQEAHTFDSEQACHVSAAYRDEQFSFVPVEVEIVAVKNKTAA